MGRFGLDHSEIMNYEFELANKDRVDHMNQLVYKSLPSQADNNEWNKENSMKLTAEVLFKRLSQKQLE